MATLILKRILVFMMAILTSLPCTVDTSMADSCADYDFPRIAAEEQAKDTLRIMSFNIRYGDVNGVKADDRRTIAVRQILEIMPDSMGLQEATPEWMKTLNRRLPFYDWVGVERGKGGDPLQGGDEACPIFYLKSKFRAEDSGNFWLSETPDEPSYGPGAACKRICTWVVLRNRLTKQRYVHVNTHFDHVSEAARVAGAEILNRFIEEHFSDLPVVFTADMNTGETGEAYATMTQNLLDTRYTAEDCVFYGTFHGGKDPARSANYRIDYILCSDDFEVASYRTVTQGVSERFTSDHFPIYADLYLPLCSVSRTATPSS